MSLNAVELVQVSKTYPGSPPVRALQETSLTIPAHHSVAVVGPSGSGKSTLLSLMGTLEAPSGGEVWVGRHRVSGLRGPERAALRGQKMGFVFQQFHLLSELSAAENVGLGLLYCGVDRKQRRERSLDMLREVGLADRANHRPAELSGGEQQRVAIARALVKRPSIVFADEPTGALDSATSHEIIDLLLQTTALGAALVVVTHDRQVASRFARRLEVLDGKVTESAKQ